MTSLSAVVSITVVLLGGPQGLAPFTMEGSYGEIALSRSMFIETRGPDGARMVSQLAGPGPGFPLQGDKTMYDAAAGLTTILGPDEATLKGLFGEGVRSTMIEPIIEGGLFTWPERKFEFLWPQDRPQYYLEKLPGLYLGYSVYGRIELVDKEGYTVSVQPGGRPPEVTLAVEFTKRTLSGGKYDETIRAFVGQPTLIKTIVSAQAPLSTGQQTLLVWLPRPKPQVVATVASAAPSWAVGEWEMTGPGDETGILTVKADGTATWYAERSDLMTDPGSVDSSGAVDVTPSLGEWAGTLSGQLTPDGTASGRISPPGFTWTAIRVQAPGIERAAPAWAVGDWEMKVGGEDAGPALMVIQPNGDVLIEDHPYAPSGAPKPSGTLSPWGQLQYRVFQSDILLVTMVGKLNPDGTGSGTGYAKEPGTGQRDRFTWTATRKGGPAEAVRRALAEAEEIPLPILPQSAAPAMAPGPAGVAVLLEVGSPQEATQAEVPSEIMALLNKPGPEIQIACKFVQIERDPDKPLDIDWTDKPEVMLRKLLTEGRAQVINAPRVTTTNNVPAEIDFSTEIPYFYATTEYDRFGNRTVVYDKTDTVTTCQWLSVKPLILADGSIQMDVDFRLDEQVGTVVGPDGTVLPVVTTRSGNTTVRVSDGETVVIGGFTRSNEAAKLKTPVIGGFIRSNEPAKLKTPLLQDIPINVGELFTSKQGAKPKTEVLILVTPKIIGDKEAARPLAEWSGPIAGETKDGEQWVWDIIRFKHAGALALAEACGGKVYVVTAGELAPTWRSFTKARPPRRPADSGYGRYGSGSMGGMLPEGMDPPLAIREHNVLLVHGTQAAIDQFRELLSYFDKPAKQIEIATKFVEVEAVQDKPFAIDWFVASGAAEPFLGHFMPGEGLRVARFRPGHFQKALRDLLVEGRAQVINEPRVTTQNNMPAEVCFSTEILDRWATLNVDAITGQRTLKYDDNTVSLGYSLIVTPRIYEDGTIVMEVEAEITDKVGTIMRNDGESVPLVTTQAAYTQVRVPDGDTIVIGGLLGDRKALDEEETSAGEPTRRTELLIFVTPRIIREVPRE